MGPQKSSMAAQVENVVEFPQKEQHFGHVLGSHIILNLCALQLGTLGPIALLPLAGSPSTFPSTTEGLLGAMVAIEI